MIHHWDLRSDAFRYGAEEPPSTPDVRNSDVNEAINEALEVASPEVFSTTQTGTTGVSTSVRVDAPEEIKLAGERADSPSTFTCNRTAKTSPAIPLPHGLIVNEHLALVTDEGANSSNAWRLHEHVQNGLDRLARRVEGVLLRAKVVEPAEVSL